MEKLLIIVGIIIAIYFIVILIKNWVVTLTIMLLGGGTLGLIILATMLHPVVGVLVGIPLGIFFVLFLIDTIREVSRY